ncbi:hypothetical protein CNMCM5793_004277 [Aspergillus hiratsukae]|uniref:Uncharacterized protein n=1 Tax=Aspergillus hiratsukae TaxID=1194566 RepID=A0A8H6QDK3_9EURO|nr:hypothetical protein CNMCM5793_004277 [Aspergillus hiratsukae]KAF7171008.1 hypothetical protein CNMCM6106_005528 [Aspergillus hiratsukae]
MGLSILFCLRRQKPESAKDPLTIAVEKWEKKLQKAKCPQDYLPFLLSNLVFVEKARILYKIANGKGLPDNLFQNPDGVEKVARQLQRAGQSDLCRLLWYFVYHQKEHGDNFMGWCQAMIALELCGRCVVQEDIYELEMLRSKREQLKPCAQPEERAEIESATRELEKKFEGLADAYHALYRVLWQLQENMPPGPLRRAFLDWRSNPDWYLCDWLRRECASQGGCCGRTCGCCEKPRDTDRLFNRGHCTSGCSCCIKTHGKADDDLDDVDSDDLEKFFEEKDNNMYARRLCRAYIWGTDVLNEIEDEEEFNCDAWLRAAEKTFAVIAD